MEAREVKVVGRTVLWVELWVIAEAERELLWVVMRSSTVFRGLGE